jgi:TetR/AcrR family transcriptional repressor of nem operon
MNKKYNREDILVAGIQLIRERGYANTGIQDILSYCGIPKGSFYNFFASKEAFALEAISFFKDKMGHILADIDAEALTPPEKIKKFALTANTLYCSSGRRNSFLLSLANEVSEDNPAFSQPISDCFEGFKGFLQKWIREGQEQGFIISALQDKEMASLLLDSYHGAVIRMRYELKPDAIVAYCEKTLQAFTT